MSVNISNSRIPQSVTTTTVSHPRRVSSSPALSDLKSWQMLRATPVVPYPTTLAMAFDSSTFKTPYPSIINSPAPLPTRKSYLSASQITANLQKLVGQSSQKLASSPTSTLTSAEMSLSSVSLGNYPLTIEQVYWCMDCCYKEIQSRSSLPIAETLSGFTETALEIADGTFNAQRTIHALLQRMVPIRFNDNTFTPSSSKPVSSTSSASTSRSSSTVSTSSRAFKTKALGASASLKRKVLQPSTKLFTRDSQKVPWEVHLRSLSTEQISEVLSEVLSMAPEDWIPHHLFDFIIRPQGHTLRDIMELLPIISQEVLKCLLSSIDTLADIASREQTQSIHIKNDIDNFVSPRTHARHTLIKRFASLVFRLDDSLASYTPISSFHPEIMGAMSPPCTYQGPDVGMFMDHYTASQSIQDKASVASLLIRRAFENLLQAYREDRQLTSDVLFPYEENIVDWSQCKLLLDEPLHDPDPPCPSLPLPPWRKKLPRSIVKRASRTQMMVIEPPEDPPSSLQPTLPLREDIGTFQVPTTPLRKSKDDVEAEPGQVQHIVVPHMLSAILSNRHPSPPPILQETAQDTEDTPPSVEANPSRRSTSRPLVPRNSLWESSPPLHALPHPLPKWSSLRPAYTYKTSYWQFKYRQRAKRCYGSMHLSDSTTYSALIRRASEPEWSHPKGRRNVQNVPSIIKPISGGPVGRSDSCGPTMTTPPLNLKNGPSRRFSLVAGNLIPPTPKIPKQVAQVEPSKPDGASESLDGLEKCQLAVRDQPTVMLLQKKSNGSLNSSSPGTRTVRIITTQTQNLNTATTLARAPEASSDNSSNIAINNNRKKFNRRSKSFDQFHPRDITPRSTSRGTATVPLAVPRISASLSPPPLPSSNVASFVYTPPLMSCSSWMPLALAPVELVDDLFQPSEGDYPATLISPMFLYTPSKTPQPEAILATTTPVSPKTSPSIQPKKSFHQLLFGKRNTKVVDPAVEENYVGIHKKKKHIWETSSKNTHA